MKEKSLYKNIFSFSAWDLVGGFSSVAQRQGINIVLNLFFGPALNAANAISAQIQGTITQFSNNFMVAVSPQITKSYADGDVKNMIKLMTNSAKFSFYLLWVLTLPIILQIDNILDVWLTVVPEYTAIFTLIIICNMLVNALRTPFITGVHATGHIKKANIISGSILISSLPIGYVSLKLGMPPPVAFYSVLFVTIVTQFIDFFILKSMISELTFSSYLSKLLLKVALTVIPSVIMSLFAFKFIIINNKFLRLIIYTSICVIFTLIVLFIIDKTVRHFANRWFHNIFKNNANH